MWRLLVLLLAVPPVVAETLPEARRVTLTGQKMSLAATTKAFKEQTGYTVDISALPEREVTLRLTKAPFWTAVLELATATESHLVTTAGRVALKPGRAQRPHYVNGPFLFVGRESAARLDLQQNTSSYDLTVDVVWEPRLNVYRIDTLPSNAEGTTNTGTKLTFPTSAPRALTTGNTITLTIRPQGLTRAATTCTVSGSLTATLADELLTFTFDSTGKPLGAATQKGVAVSVTKSTTDGNDWLVRLDLQYPKDGPTWESFEASAWKERNVLRFVPPTGNALTPEPPIDEGPLQYVFKNHAKTITNTWKLDYQTPGPMREVAIPFTLKDIRLP